MYVCLLSRYRLSNFFFCLSTPAGAQAADDTPPLRPILCLALCFAPAQFHVSQLLLICPLPCVFWSSSSLKLHTENNAQHANSILEPFEYFWQISSQLIVIISSYTVSKLGRFLRQSVYWTFIHLYQLHDSSTFCWRHSTGSCRRSFASKNVIFSVGHIDILSHATRLSSVWPINSSIIAMLQLQAQYSCVDGGAFHRCATVQTFTDAESSVRWLLAKRLGSVLVNW